LRKPSVMQGMKWFRHRTEHSNPKHEIRNPKQIRIFKMIRMQNPKEKTIERFEDLNLGFVSSFDIRNSNLLSKGR